MAGKFDQYKPQIEKFNSTYGVDFSFEAYESESAKTNAFAYNEVEKAEILNLCFFYTPINLL